MSEKQTIRLYSSDQVRERLNRAADVLGSQANLSRTLGVSNQFLNAVLTGRKEPTGKILQFLSLKRSVFYEQVEVPQPKDLVAERDVAP